MNNGFYVIGNVYGCFNTLNKLIDQFPKKINEEIYFTGNLIDYGTNSKNVLELVSNNNLKTVLGKQEYCFNYEIENIIINIENNTFNFNKTEWFKNMGGFKTLNNYQIPYLQSDITLLNKHIKLLQNLPLYIEKHNVLEKQIVVISNGYISEIWDNRKYTRTQNQKNKFTESLLWNNGINKINVNIFNVFSGEYTKEPDVTKFYCNLNTNNLTKDGYISAIHIPSMKIYKQKIIDIIK